MRFSQKAYLYNRTSFKFGEKELDFIIDDGRLKVGFSVPYHEIGAQKSIRSFREHAAWYYGISILLASLLSFAISHRYEPWGDNTIFLFFALIGALVCVVSFYMRFDATLIALPSGNTIVVFQDGHHHAIIGEITKRRKADIIRLHGELDLLNHPQLELKKLLWLKDEGILSSNEFEEFTRRLANMAKMQSGPAKP